MDTTNILIIEDDESIRDSVKILLESEGFLVSEAPSGEQGLSMLNKDTDLVILDIMLPGMSGYKICEEIRKKSVVPILFLTAKSSENDKVLGFASNGIGLKNINSMMKKMNGDSVIHTDESYFGIELIFTTL